MISSSLAIIIKMIVVTNLFVIRFELFVGSTHEAFSPKNLNTSIWYDHKVYQAVLKFQDY